MAPDARVMVVSLDAADPTLVRELADAGEMPAMARVLREGAVLDTLAPAGVFVSANWPTIFTATSPDRHGYLCWEELRGGTYDHRETDPTMVRGDPIWRRLSEAGRRVAVLDVPHSRVEPVNGTMLAEWGCHDRHFGPRSWPPELADELSARHGSHLGAGDSPGFDQFAPCDYAQRDGDGRTDEETVALFAEICDSLERKRRASLELLDRGDWDLFLNVMGESHCVGHQLWHLHDASHPRHDPELARRLGGDPVREVYRRLDAVVADHLARLAPQDTGYVLLAHGMTAHHDGTHLLDHVLHRLDWGLEASHEFAAGTRVAGELARLVPRALRGPALRAAAPLLRARTGGDVRAESPSPLAERRWFATPNNTVVGAVRLNLAGREPLGRVHPEDRRQVLRWLSDRFGELVNVDTGGRVVRRCVIADDVYRRTPGDAFGDLFVEWERSAPIERVWSPAIGTVAVPYDHWRQGDHVREGLLIATGPGIGPGRRDGAFDVADVGATFAAALDVELPDVDGQPIASVLPGAAGGRAAPVAGRRARARAGVQRALVRRRQRRTPGWARRQDPALPRLALDLTTRLQLAAEAAESAAAVVGERLDGLERGEAIAAMSAWLPDAEVPADLAISVVMPTRDRCGLLPAAISSVQAQSHPNWELLVVDDGSADATSAVLRSIEDPRVRVLHGPGRGVSAARNVALEAAHGDVIAYLDDDNRFDPDWLKAVAITFAAHPHARVCYGARLVDDQGRLLAGASSGRPWVHFLKWDPDLLLRQNVADMNVLAHPRGPVRFDEGLVYFGDWDLLAKLARGTEPVEVPAIAAHYRTDVEGRLSTRLTPEQRAAEEEAMRRRLAEAAAALDGANTLAPRAD